MNYYKKKIFNISKIILLIVVIVSVNEFDTVIYASNPTGVGNNGISLVKSFEQCRLTAYKAVSSEKYYTIGWGHYGADVTANMKITQKEADQLFEIDVVKHEKYLNTFLLNNNIKVSQYQYDALFSFTFNLGNIWKSSEYPTFKLKTILLNGISGYTAAQIRTAFTNWNKSGGVVLAGLTRRRNAEADLFLKTPLTPDKPAITSIKADSSTEITIKWGKVDNAVSYEIRRKKSGDGEGWEYYKAIGTTTDTSYKDTGLASGTLYYYGVVAINSAGNSGNPGTDNRKSAYTLTDKPRVTSVTAVSTSQLKVSWNAVNGASRYEVYRRLPGEWVNWTETYKKIADVNGTEYTDSGLSAGTTYHYGIVAINGSGEGSGNPGSENRNNGTTLVPKHAIDLNRTLDGQDHWELAECGTADIYINGNLDANDVSDYWKEWPEGTRYEIKDIRTNSDYKYEGIRSGSLSGTVGGGNVDLRLMYTTIPRYEATPGEKTLPDGWYMIASGNNNDWVLDINNWNKENGGNLELYHRNNTTNQRFYLKYLDNGFYSIMAQHSGKYIQKQGDGTSTNANVHQWDGCDSFNAQWKLIPADDGYYYLEARNGGYLDNYNASVTPANNIRVFDYNGSRAESWRFVSTNAPESEVQTLADGWYTIESRTAENLALDVAGSGMEDGANVFIWAAVKTENQQFYLQYRGDGYYTISPKHSGKYISAAGSEGQYVNVCQSDAMDKYSLWCLEPAGNGGYRVRNKNGNYLDNSGNRSNPGNNVGLYILANGVGGPAEEWDFIPYNGEMTEPAASEDFRGHTYEYYSLLLPWENARSFCEWKGGHLVTIGSQEENDFVHGLMGTGWIGASDKDEEGTFAWVTGEPFGYTNWNSGEPNNAGGNENAGKMLEDGQWNDNDGERFFTFVCEYGTDLTSIADCSISLSEESFTYDGEAKEPGVTVEYSGTVLMEGTDYVVSYENNIEAGKAAVVITGTGGYTGTAERMFMIQNPDSPEDPDDPVDPEDPDIPDPGPQETGEGLITARSTEGSTGETVAVPISMDINPGVIALSVNMGYDSSRVRLAKIESGSLLDGSAMSGDYTKNPYRLSFSNDMSMEDIEDTGVLATAYFEILADAEEGDTIIELSFEEAYDKDLKEISFRTVNGTISIQSYKPGDVNGDGQVKLNDAILLRRFVAGWDVEIDERAADVNGDGQVKLNDAILLRRYVAGWDVALK